MHRAGFRLLMIGLESAQDKSLKLLNKGFKTEDVKKAFAVLRKAKMLTNGYFIVGLFGESEEEMLEIAPYAREIGVDLISPNRLRYEKYSGLAKLLEGNDEYYIGDGNRIYSKRYGPAEINRIVKRISSEFFDARQVWAIVRKGLRIGFPGWSFYGHIIIALPRILATARRRKKRAAPAELEFAGYLSKIIFFETVSLPAVSRRSKPLKPTEPPALLSGPGDGMAPFLFDAIPTRLDDPSCPIRRISSTVTFESLRQIVRNGRRRVERIRKILVQAQRQRRCNDLADVSKSTLVPSLVRDVDAIPIRRARIESRVLEGKRHAVPRDAARPRRRWIRRLRFGPQDRATSGSPPPAQAST